MAVGVSPGEASSASPFYLGPGTRLLIECLFYDDWYVSAILIGFENANQLPEEVPSFSSYDYGVCTSALYAVDNLPSRNIGPVPSLQAGYGEKLLKFIFRTSLSGFNWRWSYTLPIVRALYSLIWLPGNILALEYSRQLDLFQASLLRVLFDFSYVKHISVLCGRTTLSRQSSAIYSVQ